MDRIIEAFASNLELFLNVIELIALIISVVTVIFLMLNKYNKGLKKFLRPAVWAFGQE